MVTWVEDLKEKVDNFHTGLLELHKKYEPDSELFRSIAEGYMESVHELYRQDYLLAQTLDSSRLIARYSGTAELHPTFSLVSHVCKSLHGSIRAMAETIFQMRAESIERISWPEELRPNLSGIVLGDLAVGVRIGPRSEGQLDTTDMFSNELCLMTKDVERALDGVADISKHLTSDGLSQEFKDRFPDPARRDTIVSAASKLAPTGKRGIREVRFHKRGDTEPNPVPLNQASRATLNKELRRPNSTASEGEFSGVVRAIDLDARRCVIRHVDKWGSVRCAYNPSTLGVAQRDLLNSTVKVEGLYESAPGEDAPRLLYVNSLEVIAPAGRQDELEF